MQTAYCMLCGPSRTGLKAPFDALQFVKRAHYVRGVPAKDLEQTRRVFGESDSTVWLLPDGRPRLHVPGG